MQHFRAGWGVAPGTRFQAGALLSRGRLFGLASRLLPHQDYLAARFYLAASLAIDRDPTRLGLPFACVKMTIADRDVIDGNAAEIGFTVFKC